MRDLALVLAVIALSPASATGTRRLRALHTEHNLKRVSAGERASRPGVLPCCS